MFQNDHGVHIQFIDLWVLEPACVSTFFKMGILNPSSLFQNVHQENQPTRIPRAHVQRLSTPGPADPCHLGSNGRLGDEAEPRRVCVCVCGEHAKLMWLTTCMAFCSHRDTSS